jgi:hypothetical protein
MFGRRASNQVTADEELRIRAAHVRRPSVTEFWFGDWGAGDRFTREQRYELAKLGIAAETVRVIEVRVAVSDRELWWPTTEAAPHRLLPCPVVGQRLDRLKVVAPNGWVKLVYSDGSLTRRRAA